MSAQNLTTIVFCTINKKTQDSWRFSAVFIKKQLPLLILTGLYIYSTLLYVCYYCKSSIVSLIKMSIKMHFCRVFLTIHCSCFTGSWDSLSYSSTIPMTLLIALMLTLLTKLIYTSKSLRNLVSEIATMKLLPKMCMLTTAITKQQWTPTSNIKIIRKNKLGFKGHPQRFPKRISDQNLFSWLQSWCWNAMQKMKPKIKPFWRCFM